MVSLGILTAIGLGQPTELTGAVISYVVQGLYERFQDQKHHGLDIEVKEAWTIAAGRCADQYSPGAAETLKKRKFFIALQTYGEELPHEKVDRDLVRALAIGDKDNYMATATACVARVYEVYEQANTPKQHFSMEEWYSELLEAFAGALLYTFLQVIKQSSHEKGFKDFLRYNLEALKANDQIHTEMLDEILDKLEKMPPGGEEWMKMCGFIESQNSEVIMAVELVGISLEEFRADISTKIAFIDEFLRKDYIEIRDERDAAQKERDQKVGEVIALKEQLEVAGNKLVEAKVTHATNQQYLQGEIERITAELQVATEALAKANADRKDLDVDAIVQQARHLIAAGKKVEAYALFDQEDAIFAERKIQKMFVQLDNADWTLAMETWLAQKVNASREQKLEVASRLNYLVSEAQRRGSYFQPLPAQLEAFSIRKEVLGMEHPDSLISMSNLATLYDLQGTYIEADPLYADTFRLMKKVLGDNHRFTLNCMNNIGQRYLMQEKFAEAEELLVDAFTGRKQVLGKEHSDTIVSMNNLAALYKSTKRYAEAESLYWATLRLSKKVLGEENQITLVAMNNLGELYRVQRNFAKSEPILVKTLRIRKRVLGKEHPNTLASMNNLALLYVDQRRNAKAQPLFEETLELRKQILGEAHPHAIQSMYNLATLLYKRGNAEKCARLLRAAERLSRNLDNDFPYRKDVLSGMHMLRIQRDP